MQTFNISNDTIVVTSSFVTEQLLPIVEVTHEEDEHGGSLWQFHCGNGDYALEQIRLVRLDTILRIDPSVVEVAALPVGAIARREEIGKVWVIQGP